MTRRPALSQDAMPSREVPGHEVPPPGAQQPEADVSRPAIPRLAVPRLAIIADDLTGALDSAAPFAARGMRTIAALSADGLRAALRQGAEVISVSTSSREVSEAEARRRVAEVADILASSGVELCFKKIDSRLKGHMIAETEAVAARFGLGQLLVAPAIPDMGRMVRDGQVTGAGVAHPIPIAERLGPLAARALIPDTPTDAAMAAALAAAPTEDLLLVGARGLANSLAARLATDRAGASAQAPTPRQPPASAPPSASPHAPAATPTTFPGPSPAVGRPADLPPVARVLAAIGSIDPVTREQLDRLRAARPEITCQQAPNGDASGAGPTPPALIIATSAGAIREAGRVVTARFARTVAARLRDAPPDLLICTGGETAAAILLELGALTLTLHGEVLPGVPLSTVRVMGRDMFVMTKSGGFGPPETLCDLFPQLSPPQPDRE